MDSTQEQTPKEKAVVLLSGGLDSTVSFAKAMASFHVVMALTVAYGQRATKKELFATSQLADYYRVPQRIIHLPWMEEWLPVAMKATRDEDVLQELEAPADPMAVTTVWVPNRNGVLLNIAASAAEAHQAKVVVFGANLDEAADFPDNTQTYCDAVSHSLSYSTLNQVQIETPVAGLSKHEIINEGLRLKAPLHLIWSCYEAGEKHCGQCASCMRLKQAAKNTDLTIPFAG